MKRALSGWMKNAPAFTVLAAVVVASYWKLALMQGVLITDDIFTSDIMNDGFPYRFFLGKVLRSGELPLWYPPVYGGFPLLARAEAGICYPLNLLLFGLLDPYVALNIVILLTIIIAGWGMILYAREIGASTHGALLAGVAFAYSGFMVSHLKHLSMVNSACWFPLGLLAIERGLRTEGNGGAARVRAMLLLGVVFALQNLAGHIQIAYYSGLAYVAYYAARLFSLRKTLRGRTGGLRELLSRGGAFRFLAAMAIGSLMSAVQILPTYELVGHSQRAEGVSFEYASAYPYDPASFWTFLYPPVHGEPGHATYRGPGIFWEDYGYVGLVTFILAGVAIARQHRSAHVRMLAGGALLAYIIVLGRNTPLFSVAFDLIPMMKFFRFPTRMLFVVDAALAALAALGLTHVAARAPAAEKEARPGLFHAVAPAAILAVAVADLLFFQLRQNAIAPLGEWRTPPRTAAFLAPEAGAYRIYSQGADFTHIAAYERASGWLGSLEPYIAQREFLQPSLPVLYGFSTPNGYAQLTPAAVVDVWGDQNRAGIWNSLAGLTRARFEVRAPYQKLLSLHNVKTVLSPLPIVGEDFRLRATVGNVMLYDNPGVLPRAFVVGSYRRAPDMKSSLALLASRDFHPEREAILLDDPGIVPHDSVAGTATIESSRTNEVTVRARASEAAILVLSETYYPGWEAQVDGAPARLLRADYTLRAVVIPAGDHTVRFLFRPMSVLAGALVTLAGCVMMGAMLLLAGRRRP